MDPTVEVESFSFTAKTFCRWLLRLKELSGSPAPLSTLVEPRGDVLDSHFPQGVTAKNPIWWCALPTTPLLVG